MIQINIDTSGIEQELSEIKKSLNDFTGLWNHLYRSGLPGWFDRTFETEGFGNWEPTKRSNPILTDTGRYRASFVEGTSETIDERSALQWDYGSQTPYGIYHEEESSNLPIRSVIGELVENTGFQNWLNTEIEKYFAGIINV